MNDSSSRQRREEQAQLVLPALGKCLVERAKGLAELPESALPFPASIEAAKKGYVPNPGEVQSKHIYNCAPAEPNGPYLIQVRWYRVSPREGAFFASIDGDGDGQSDTWFETPIRCDNAECVVPLLAYQVDADGNRTTKNKVEEKWMSRTYSGPTPRAVEEGRTRYTSSSGRATLAVQSAVPAPTAAVPSVELTGQSMALPLLEAQIEKLVAGKMKGAVLTGYSVVGATDENIEPSNGELVRLSYGVPESGFSVPKGAEILTATYDKSGLAWTTSKAGSAVNTSIPGCTAAQAVRTHHPASLQLIPAIASKPAAWALEVLKPKKTKVFVSLDNCLVTRR